MLEFDVLQSGLVILLLLALGDVLTHFTRGAVPAVLFAGLAYMLCCWAGVLPGDLLESSGLGELPAAVMMMVIVNMGASTSQSLSPTGALLCWRCWFLPGSCLHSSPLSAGYTE